MNRNVTPYTTTQEFDLGVGAGVTATQDFVVNSLAYNPQDGYLYALTYPANNSGDGSGEFPQVRMYRIGQTGVQDLGVTTVDGFTPGAGQPLTRYPQYAAGVIDRNGNFYVAPRNLGASGGANENRNTLFRFRLGGATPLNAERFTLRNAANTALLNPNTQASTPENTINFIDLGIDPTDNALYGIYFPGLIYRFAVPATPGNTPVTAIGARLPNTNAAYDDNLGTAFFDITGNFYAYSNEGNFYAINKATGVATDIGDVTAAAVSDGASCVNPEQRIDVVKEVTAIVPTNTAGRYTVDFSIKVRNTGTVTTTNVQVSDFLAGAANNTTFPTATTVTVSNLLVTNSNGATLATNTAYTGQGANADLLTGTQPLTAGQEATITFRATVSYGSAAAVPSTVQNNTAYASSISGTIANPGYSLQGANGALILPPGDLVATDASTNSAALPDTPNGDVPSPSPVYFGLAILGNVFEDSNYGGGAGRSQAASNGAGVNQARVELYLANSGSFVAATTTDVDGNYSFVDGVNNIDLNANTTYRVRVVNSTVVSNRSGSIAGLWPVQTFSNGDVNQVGGENPNKTDYGNRSTALPAINLSTTLEIQSITPSTGNGSVRTSTNGPIVGVDFGFNFDTVVNTNDSGQGSLRQFITNANNLGNDNLSQAYAGAIAGQEAAIFMLNDGRVNGAPAGLRNNMPAVTGYSALTKTFTITPTAALPAITASNTTIDGARQTAVTGNNIVPTAETTTGPEVVLNFNNLAGLLVTGGSTHIENLGLNNARGTSTAATAVILADGAGVTFSGAATAGSVLSMVTTAGNTTAGARLQSGATGVTVTNNVLNGSAAVGSVTGEGLVLAGASRNTISNNTLSNNSGFGLLLEAGQTNDGNTISTNILRNNGLGTSTEDAGLVIASGNNNLISQNIFSANAGTAVVAAAGTSGNRISQNSMSGNTGIGIDLMAAGTTGLNGDNVTRNDNTDADTGANGLLNFPVLTQAVTNGGNLIVTGYAPAGALVELFVADVTTNGFGEGKTYLTSWTEGSAQDTDKGQWGYSGLISGVNQGEESVANRFTFAIPLTSLSAAQQAALGADARLTATATLLTTVNSLAVGNTSEFSGNTALLQNRPLPVELVRFSAVARTIDAHLTWITASEKNNARFVVERSFTGDKFEAIGTVNGQGNSAEGHTYQFTDQQAATTTGTIAYYRLRQEDADGSSSYSSVQVVRFNGLATPQSLMVYPNPTASDASLDLRGLPIGTCQVSLADLAGRVIITNTVNTGQVFLLVTTQLPRGSYLVSILGMGQKKTVILVKE